MLFLLSIKYVEPVKFEQRTDIMLVQENTFDGIMLDAAGREN